MSILRLAEMRDASGVAEIYAPIVRSTAISFETEAPDEASTGERIAQTLERFPWVVCEDEGAVVGYAYATTHRTRAAYRWSVDVSVYVDESRRGRGVGRSLYSALFSILRVQGFCVAHAAITLPNAASVAIHESMGFEPVGVYRAVGFKLGAWHDVSWWRLGLQGLSAAPAEVVPLREIAGDAAVARALATGVDFLADSYRP